MTLNWFNIPVPLFLTCDFEMIKTMSTLQSHREGSWDRHTLKFLVHEYLVNNNYSSSITHELMYRSSPVSLIHPSTSDYCTSYIPLSAQGVKVIVVAMRTTVTKIWVAVGSKRTPCQHWPTIDVDNLWNFPLKLRDLGRMWNLSLAPSHFSSNCHFIHPSQHSTTIALSYNKP